MVERLPVKEMVAGSNPACGATKNRQSGGFLVE